MTIRIGLVSDTHYPVRCSELPPALFRVLHHVDLILHAGDIGDLSVLDQLSALAPVIGVYGNDEIAAARSALPYKTTIATNGVRLFLWHSHYKDRRLEFASRQEDAFAPKLLRTAYEAKADGASIAVFGHWHIPLARVVDGVTLINPGAVASGNEITRQLMQTVGVLDISESGEFTYAHVNLAEPEAPFDPQIDWEAGFTKTLSRFSASIFEPALLSRLHSVLGRVSAGEQDQLRPLVLELARQCWDGALEQIDTELFRSALAKDASLSAADRRRYLDLLQ